MIKDYSGELISELEYRDFSKKALVGLVDLYAQFFRAIDGFWYLAVSKRFGNEAALDCDIEVWYQVCPYQMARLSRTMNIHGADVASAMKAIQLNPWLRLTDFSMEMDSDRRGILTVRRCPTLLALEKEGKGREGEICRRVDTRIFNDYARCFNPEIEANPLVLPPRKGPGEICCQWEFTLVSKAAPSPA
jgi:hypothetical protein